MPTSRQNSSPGRRRGDELRGPVAIVFLIAVVGVFLFQQLQQGKVDLPAVKTLLPDQQEQTGNGSSAGLSTTSSIQAWFTDPLNSKSRGPELALIEDLKGAQKTIDMAIYNLTMSSVGDALLAAHQRGVTVRLVMESESMSKDLPQKLKKAGIPIIGDNREGLMHNKFVVIDGQQIWTGSLNLAQSAAYNDFNNMVRLRSQRLAQDYEVAFNEMFVEGLFGSMKRANTPYPRVTIDGIPVEVYFSPDDGVAQHIIDAIGEARTSIDFMVYSFTSDEIAQAIKDRAAAGVKVRGVFDQSQYESNQGTEYDYFKKAGYDVRLDGVPGLLHSKVFIIDGQVVITGSYNFSYNAERVNDENLLIIHSPDLGAVYQEEFEYVFDNGK